MAKKFQENPLPLLMLGGAVFIVFLVQGLVQGAIIDAVSPEKCTSGQFFGEVCTRSFTQAIVGSIVVAFIFGIISWIVRIGITRAALKATQGETPSIEHLTSTENLGAYLVAAILFGIASVVGLALCIIPGLIVIFLFQFSPLLALDKGVGVGDAFRRSYTMVTENVGPTILLMIINAVAAFLSGILWGIFAIVLVPISLLVTAHVYRQILREPIAA